MKRLLALASLISLLFSSLAFAEWTEFSDVDSENDYYVSISTLMREGVIEGYDTGNFEPYSPINRAELAKVVVEVFDMELESENSECFPDVPSGQWYTAYVCTTQREGIFQGDDEGNFNLADSTNRAEYAAVVSRLMNLYGVSEEVTSSEGAWYSAYFTQEIDLNISPRSITEDEEDEQAGRAVSRMEVIEGFFRILALLNHGLDDEAYTQDIRDSYLVNLGYTDLVEESYLGADSDYVCDDPETEEIEICYGSGNEEEEEENPVFAGEGYYCGTVSFTENSSISESGTTSTANIDETYVVEFFAEDQDYYYDITVTEMSGTVSYAYTSSSDDYHIYAHSSGSYQGSGEDDYGSGEYWTEENEAHINFSPVGFTTVLTQDFTTDTGTTSGTTDRTWTGSGISNLFEGQEFDGSQIFTSGSLSFPVSVGTGSYDRTWSFSPCG
jgi:hypothetical protein